MFKLVSSIGFALALADLKRRIGYWVRSGILIAVAAVLAIVALSFLLVAAHLALSRWIDPIASAAIIGGVLLLVALILFYVASRPMRKRPAAPVAPDRAGGAPEGMPEGLAEFGQTLLRNPLFPAAAMALAAGFFLGRRTKSGKGED